MNLYNELITRGIVAQVINENALSELLNKHKIKFYIGFDPTADSLHVGHLFQLILISFLQKHGHTPICLFGGGTGTIGDPSGKCDMRRLMTQEEIEHNVSCFKKQAEKFIDVPNTIFVDNSDWLLDLNYIKFMRDIGVHFSVNRMLAADCYKQRLDSGLTFFEMNYMLMQSYDFFILNEKYNCCLQIGGNDQWSNIIAGVELIKKKSGKKAFGMTTNLLTTSDGKKMGKTEKGALWLDANKTSPYEFYQYWRNIADNDVCKCLKLFTSLNLDEIAQYEKLSGIEFNKTKEVLAFELTKIVHGEKEANKSQITSRNLFAFNNINTNNDIPEKIISEKAFTNQEISIVDVLVVSKIVKSKSEARRLIEQNGITINNVVQTLESKISIQNFKNGVIIKKGKKNYFNLKNL
ncbi:MAG: tyrosine--tRNA ligase [Oscillospiraceae bacterium]|nr:tyrosine--tRNA ligase [Oscillospiraceae bacterium]